MIGAKAQPTNTLLPIVEKQKSVTLRNGCTVRRIVYREGRQMARAAPPASTTSTRTAKRCFQPADLVFLGSWTLNNTRLLLLSGIGEPYDPATGKGVVGRNLTHQVSFTAAQAFFEKPLNRFMGAAASGHAHERFRRRRASITATCRLCAAERWRGIGQGFQPIVGFGAVPPSVKQRWGAEWKKQAIDWYDRVGAIGFAGEHIAYKEHYLDLDPTYKDHLGDPLIRDDARLAR